MIFFSFTQIFSAYISNFLIINKNFEFNQLIINWIITTKSKYFSNQLIYHHQRRQCTSFNNIFTVVVSKLKFATDDTTPGIN